MTSVILQGLLVWSQADTSCPWHCSNLRNATNALEIDNASVISFQETVSVVNFPDIDKTNDFRKVRYVITLAFST